MKYPFLRFLCVVVVVLTGAARSLPAAPPFPNTGFLTTTLITPDDPTLFQSISGSGQGNREMFDRRVNDWVTVNAFLFQVNYSDGTTLEAQVHPEFGDATTAQAEATTYARFVGQLPKCLRRDIVELWILQGNQPWGGGNGAILIHTGKTPEYELFGNLEEILVHEAAHTSLDADHAASAGWLAAQTADGEFISDYARDYPDREDIAETFLVYFALSYRPDRLSAFDRDTIAQTIPNRMAYLDEQNFDVAPFALPAGLAVTQFAFDQQTGQLDLTWASDLSKSYQVQTSSSLGGWVDLGSVVASQGNSTSVSIPGNPVGAEGYFQIKEVPSQ